MNSLLVSRGDEAAREWFLPQPGGSPEEHRGEVCRFRLNAEGFARGRGVFSLTDEFVEGAGTACASAESWRAAEVSVSGRPEKKASSGLEFKEVLGEESNCGREKKGVQRRGALRKSTEFAEKRKPQEHRPEACAYLEGLFAPGADGRLRRRGLRLQRPALRDSTWRCMGILDAGVGGGGRRLRGGRLLRCRRGGRWGWHQSSSQGAEGASAEEFSWTPGWAMVEMALSFELREEDSESGLRLYERKMKKRRPAEARRALGREGTGGSALTRGGSDSSGWRRRRRRLRRMVPDISGILDLRRGTDDQGRAGPAGSGE